MTSASAWAVTSAKSSSSRASVAASMLGTSWAPDHERLVPTQVATRSATSHDTGLLLTPTVYGAAGPVVIRAGRRARDPGQAVTVRRQALFRPRNRGAEPASCW